MQDAMVTARMSQAKKEAGNEALKKMGISASQFINDMYDYLISYGVSPVKHEQTQLGNVDPEQLAQALAHVKSFALPAKSKFKNMTHDEIKRERLISRGLMEVE